MDGLNKDFDEAMLKLCEGGVEDSTMLEIGKIAEEREKMCEVDGRH